MGAEHDGVKVLEPRSVSYNSDRTVTIRNTLDDKQDKITDDDGFLKGLLTQFKSDDGYRTRLLQTMCVAFMFITLGSSLSLIGSTFPDLRLIMEKNLETASWLFSVRKFGSLLGSLVSGPLFDKFNRLVLLSAVTAFSGITTSLLPWCQNFPLILFVAFMNGVFNGAINVGGNSHITTIWKLEAAPYMQIIHFGYSFGGIISPLVADPFLAEKHCSGSDLNSTQVNYTDMTTSASYLVITNTSVSNTTECAETYGETKVQFAYLIVGIISLLASTPFMLMYMLSSRNNSYSLSDKVDADVNEQEMVKGVTANSSEGKETHLKSKESRLPELPLSTTVLFISMFTVLFGLFVSAESQFAALLSTFVSGRLKWSTSDSLHVTSLFWGTFTAGRLIGIPATKFLRPATMVAVYLIAVTVSIIGFSFAATFEITILVWVSTALAGLFMSVIFPCIFTWTTESILTVTGKISAVYLVGFSVCSMLFPLLYGYLMDNFDDMYFVYILTAQLVACFVVFVIIKIMIGIFITPLSRVSEKKL